jgi:hypothetical protein
MLCELCNLMPSTSQFRLADDSTVETCDHCKGLLEPSEDGSRFVQILSAANRLLPVFAERLQAMPATLELKGFIQDVMRAAVRLERPESSADRLKVVMTVVLCLFENLNPVVKRLIKDEINALIEQENAQTDEELCAIVWPENALGLLGLWNDCVLDYSEQRGEL